MKTPTSAKHIYFFLGTTAELIKVLPVMESMKREGMAFKIISSGQNVLNTKELEPIFGPIKVDIAFEHKKGSHKISTKNFVFWAILTFYHAAVGLRKEFSSLKRENSFLIVHGDTVSSMLGAIIGKIYGLKVVHIESGLRSFDYFEPFPEEICRKIVSSISDVHFSPNAWAMKNLSDIQGVKINTKKNIVIESLFQALKVTPRNLLPKKIQNEKYFMFMMHRQEHMLFNKHKNRQLIETVIESIPKQMKCLIIMHSLTEEFLRKQDMLEQIKKNKNVRIVVRQPYTVFARIMNECEFMITDGGSTQEEAYYLGKPCLIIRNKTERIEGLNQNALLSHGDLTVIKNFMLHYKKYRKHKIALNPKPSTVVTGYFTKV